MANIDTVAQPKARKARKVRSQDVAMKAEGSTVTFGSVTVVVTPPSTATTRKNIKAGKDALARAKPALSRQGVNILRSKNVPLFYADPKSPGTIIREMNGVITRGTYLNGEFRVVRQRASSPKKA